MKENQENLSLTVVYKRLFFPLFDIYGCSKQTYYLMDNVCRYIWKLIKVEPGGKGNCGWKFLHFKWSGRILMLSRCTRSNYVDSNIIKVFSKTLQQIV